MGVNSSASARRAAGFTPEQAAKRARVSVGYLTRIERRGGAPFPLAQRLSRLYGCRLDAFLSGGTTPSKIGDKKVVSEA